MQPLTVQRVCAVQPRAKDNPHNRARRAAGAEDKPPARAPEPGSASESAPKRSSGFGTRAAVRRRRRRRRRLAGCVRRDRRGAPFCLRCFGGSSGRSPDDAGASARAGGRGLTHVESVRELHLSISLLLDSETHAITSNEQLTQAEQS